MPKHIRINSQDLPRQTARAALSVVRKKSGSEDNPLLVSSADADGFYEAVIENPDQERLFKIYLGEQSVPFDDLQL